jgi:RNA-directed DNA polymerase
MSGDVHVRICERLGVRLPRATRRVVTCKSAAEARSAVEAAGRILKQLGVELHPQKTRIVHVRYGFEFLGYKIKRGKKLHLPESKIRSQARSGALYATRVRSRSNVSGIRYGNEPNGGSL